MFCKGIIFIEESARFEIKGGLVHSYQQIGSLFLHRVQLLSTFRQSIRLANKALEEFDATGSAEIIPFPDVPAAHG